jgi:hypothetical protein
LRFSVRGLIVVVLLVGGWLGWLVRTARIQREAVAAIEAAGGEVRYDWEWSNGNNIRGEKPWVPRWIVDQIGVDCIGHVRCVLLENPDDDVMRSVGQLSRIEVLCHFEPSPVLTDAGMAHLNQLPGLRLLSIHGARVTDRGMVCLKGLTEMSQLDLRYNRISDAGLANLKGLTKLSMLVVNCNQITDAGLVHLKRLTKLTELDLSHTNVADAGMAQLSGLNNLSKLGLGDTRVTDAGLAHLKTLTRLSALDVSDTEVTEAGAKDLKRALPNLRVER